MDGSHSKTWKQPLVFSNYLFSPQIEIKLTVGKFGNDSFCGKLRSSILAQFHQLHLTYIKENPVKGGTVTRTIDRLIDQSINGSIVPSLLVQDFWSSCGYPNIAPPKDKDSSLLSLFHTTVSASGQSLSLYSALEAFGTFHRPSSAPEHSIPPPLN